MNKCYQQISLAALLTAALCASASASGYMSISGNGAWDGNATQMSLQSDAAFWTAFQAEVANGGNLTFEYTVVEADQSFGSCVDDDGNAITHPRWFEPVVIFNSQGPADPANPGSFLSGWDQNTISTAGLYGSNWPLTGSYSTTVTIPLTASAPANDNAAYVDVSAGWTNLHFGINSDNTDGCVTCATIQIDNITVGSESLTFDSDLEEFTPNGDAKALAWTAVPEPDAGLLFALLALALFVTRRRR